MTDKASRLQTFVPRLGKNFTRKFGDQYPQLKAQFNPSFSENFQHLEIGFGYGEHLLYRAQQQPDERFLGCEPYKQGAATLMHSLVDQKLKNVAVHDGDFFNIRDQIKCNSFKTVYILFPDPWNKKAHHKRRLVTHKTLLDLHTLLRDSGKIVIATDHYDYAMWIKNVVNSQSLFTWQNSESLQSEPSPWIKTRYQLKALKAGREASFFILVKK